MNLDTHRLKTLAEVRDFLAGSTQFQFTLTAREDAYDWIETTLRQLGYARLGKADRGLVKAYVEKVTGFSRAQVTRLIRQYRRKGRIRDRRGPPAKPFERRYGREDVALLAEVDTLHGTLSGPATRKLCERAFEIFGDARCARLAQISNGHLYNLRHSSGYRRRRRRFEKTRPKVIKIGDRRKPNPEGKPGYLRVDSVHQGDLDGIKGLYHINAVDPISSPASPSLSSMPSPWRKATTKPPDASTPPAMRCSSPSTPVRSVWRDEEALFHRPGAQAPKGAWPP